MAPGESSRERLEKVLVSERVVSSEALEQVLAKKPKTAEALLDLLINDPKVDARQLIRAISQFYGYSSVNLDTFVIHGDIKKIIPDDLKEKYKVYPISSYEGTLTVAFANPANLMIVDELRSLTGLRIKPVVAQLKQIQMHIRDESVEEKKVEEKVAGVPLAGNHEELKNLVKMVETDSDLRKDRKAEDLLRVAKEAPVIRLVNMLLLEGIRRRASDIFIEPWDAFIRVRVRVDGLLEEIICPQKFLGAAIVSRIKIMSELNIAEHRIPQDGRIKVKLQGREVDLRISILPTSFGEKVCIRILDTHSQSHDISKLGFTENEQQIIRDSSKKPHGMILVTGPTGSGKTTTLYSVLESLHSTEVNITTVEDPVEYQIPGINQVHVRETVGLTFPAALRSILRQDPDIILIGEIRDAETLDIAVKAALTGHLVLSTLHTNDAASSVTRMINMGLEPFLISSTVLMISAQRLVRKVCPKCKVMETVDSSVLTQLGLDPKARKYQFFKGQGCHYCRSTGYSGRTVITEIFKMTPAVRQSIMEGKSGEDIKKEAIAEGMNTLRMSAIQKALTGETSIEEVFRVTSSGS